jgi:hypothetical protein
MRHTNTGMLARINRKLALGGQCLKTADDGSYFVEDFKRRKIINRNVDVRELAVDLGLLRGGWKRVQDRS